MRPPRSNESTAGYHRDAPADTAVQAERVLWPTMADGFDPETQERVAASLEAGGAATFADVVALELAEVHRMMSDRRQAEERLEQMEELVDQLAAKKPRTPANVKANASRIASLDRRIVSKSKDVMDLTKLIGSKMRHLRLIIERQGSGGTKNRPVNVPKELAAKMDEVAEQWVDELDLLAPVPDPAGLE